MEIPLGTNKEKKRRFFRKNGLSSSSSSRGGQNSWESNTSSPTTSQSAISSLNTSFENTSISSTGYPGTSTPPSGINSPRSKTNNNTLHHRPNVSGNSISLDEAEHILQQHRRFMAAPRRARSAERFDGMRINYSGLSSGEKFHYPFTREELLDRNKFCSPRPTRLPTTGTSNLVNDPRRNQVPTSASGVATPPPPYQAAILNEKTGPPSYRQALATAAAASYAAHNQKAGTALYSRQTALAHHRGGAQSFDTEFGTTGSMMRSAVSVPAFSNDIVCSCSKCQISNKGLSSDMGYGYGGSVGGDDAVYMESQAFLMHEIMTDGMAFCSIM